MTHGFTWVCGRTFLGIVQWLPGVCLTTSWWQQDDSKSLWKSTEPIVSFQWSRDITVNPSANQSIALWLIQAKLGAKITSKTLFYRSQCSLFINDKLNETIFYTRWKSDLPTLLPHLGLRLPHFHSCYYIIAQCIHFSLSASSALSVSLLTLCCKINASKHTVHTCSTGCKRNQQLKGKYHFIWPVTATSSQALCLPRCWVKVAQALLLLWYGL